MSAAGAAVAPFRTGYGTRSNRVVPARIDAGGRNPSGSAGTAGHRTREPEPFRCP